MVRRGVSTMENTEYILEKEKKQQTWQSFSLSEINNLMAHIQSTHMIK